MAVEAARALWPSSIPKAAWDEVQKNWTILVVLGHAMPLGHMQMVTLKWAKIKLADGHFGLWTACLDLSPVPARVQWQVAQPSFSKCWVRQDAEPDNSELADAWRNQCQRWLEAMLDDEFM